MYSLCTLTIILYYVTRSCIIRSMKSVERVLGHLPNSLLHATLYCNNDTKHSVYICIHFGFLEAWVYVFLTNSLGYTFRGDLLFRSCGTWRCTAKLVGATDLWYSLNSWEKYPACKAVYLKRCFRCAQYIKSVDENYYRYSQNCTIRAGRSSIHGTMSSIIVGPQCSRELCTGNCLVHLK